MSHLASYEVLLLFSPNITLAGCKSLNPKTLFPAPQDDNNHDCLMLTIFSLLGLIYKKFPLIILILIWFTDGSFLKDEQGHYLFYMQ